MPPLDRAARWEEEGPSHGHRDGEMPTAELRGDAQREAVLAQPYDHGTASEGPFLLSIHQRLIDAGIEPGQVTVDGLSTGVELIAPRGERGFALRFNQQAHWPINVAGVREDGGKRDNGHGRHEACHGDAFVEHKAVLLVRHGEEQDREAVGCWLRDREIEGLGEAEVARRGWIRLGNEAWPVPVKRLRFELERWGQREMLRGCWAWWLRLPVVGLTRFG